MFRDERKFSPIFLLIIVIVSFSTNCLSTRRRGKEPATSHNRQHQSTANSSSSSDSNPTTSQSGISTSFRTSRNMHLVSDPRFVLFLQHSQRVYTTAMTNEHILEEYQYIIDGIPQRNSFFENSILKAEALVECNLSFYNRWEKIDDRPDVRIGSDTESPEEVRACDFTVLVDVWSVHNNITVSPKLTSEDIMMFREYELYRCKGTGTFMHIRSKGNNFSKFQDNFINIRNYIAALLINFNIFMRPVNIFGIGLGGNLAANSMNALRKFISSEKLPELHITAINPLYLEELNKLGVAHVVQPEIFNMIITIVYILDEDFVIIFTPAYVKTLPRNFNNIGTVILFARGCENIRNIMCYIALRETKRISLFVNGVARDIITIDRIYNERNSTFQGSYEVLMYRTHYIVELNRYHEQLAKSKSTADD